MPWKIAADRVGKRLLGKTMQFLNGSCYSGECNMANLITDAMVDHVSCTFRMNQNNCTLKLYTKITVCK